MARDEVQRTVETTTTTTTKSIDDHEKHRKAASLMGTVASTVKLLSSIIIICLTRFQIDRVLGCFYSVGLKYSVCQYAYALGAVGIFLALMSAATQCGPLARMGRASATGQSLVHGLNVVWWVAGAVVLSIYHHQAPGLPPSSYRKGVLALAWICAILSIIMYAITNMLGCGPRRKNKKTLVEKTVDVV